MNRLTLRVQYHLADHIFVHTDQMKHELVSEFGVSEGLITVISYGINNEVPHTDLTTDEAKRRLGIGPCERVILFFGNIAPYKGLDYLAAAFQQLRATGNDYRLIIAGKPKKGSEGYLQQIQDTIATYVNEGRVIQKIEHIVDEEVEIYFKAADVLVLPYREIFQSGVLFFGYSFGLPVIATDVGAMKENIIEGKTGFVCKPADTGQLVKAIETYFKSELFKHLNDNRPIIREYANSQHSWEEAGQKTRDVYAQLLEYR
jgi:glycosyltransferase involved in cell wall biosynthesis